MEPLCGEGRSEEGRQGGHPGSPLGMCWRPPPPPRGHSSSGWRSYAGAGPFLSQTLSTPLQASPTTVPAAGARPRQDGIFPTLPHLASGTKRDAPRAHPRRKSRSSAEDLKPPALSDPHSSPQATDSSGANTVLDFKNKNLKIPTPR